MISIKQISKSLDCKGVLQCFFGLNSEDIRVYEAIENGLERVEEISNFLGKSGNTVYKSIQKLLVSGLIYREKKILEGGGYYFAYKPIPREFVAREIENILKEFCEKVRQMTRDFLDRSIRLQGLRNLQ